MILETQYNGLKSSREIALQDTSVKNEAPKSFEKYLKIMKNPGFKLNLLDVH